MRAHLSRALADAFLAGPWKREGLLDRATETLRPRPRWLPGLVDQVLVFYPRLPADRPRELSDVIEISLRWLPDDEDEPPIRVRRWMLAEREMGRLRWPVPEIATVGELAKLVEVTPERLAWLADARGLERTVAAQRLRNYRYMTLERPGRPVRVIEQPKHQLKRMQRWILHEVLDHIPVHAAAQGFTRGRSVRTHAKQHTGKHVVVRLDLEDFFASIAAGRAFGIFRSAGYPESVAHALTALTTNTVPSTLWHSLPRPSDPAQISLHHRLGGRLATPHLPQGAPTSPALANLAAFRLDRRLAGLAATLDLTYSRYADDLTFSGAIGLARGAVRLRETVSEIAGEEGFRINQLKSTFTTSAGSQRVCGVVVNERLNIPRREYDLLRAILHNARIHGPAPQNRRSVPDFRAHLLGRIAWVASLNSARGSKLRREFDRIEWK
jgi:RNA-directed DNA polymerase